MAKQRKNCKITKYIRISQRSLVAWGFFLAVAPAVTAAGRVPTAPGAPPALAADGRSADGRSADGQSEEPAAKPKNAADTFVVPRPQPGEPERRWAVDTEHRFLWLEGREKVGETVFRITRVPHEDTHGYVVDASRSYNRRGISHRGRSTTILTAAGLPLHFQEMVHLGTASGALSSQETTVEAAAGKAHVVSQHNGPGGRRVERDIESPENAFLYANQAVEHWAILTTALPNEFERNSLLVLYPDQDRVLVLQFEAKETESLRHGEHEVETRRVAFHSASGGVSGTVWLDKAGRLAQIRFANSSLRVVRVLKSP